MTDANPGVLPLHLWDLRAQLEAQLRCLTKVHRWVDDFASLGADDRARLKRAILENLDEIRTTGSLVATVSAQAISVANKTL